jgi:4'-phosphopantetheinyl transferase
MLRTAQANPGNLANPATGVEFLTPHIGWPLPPEDLKLLEDEVHVFGASLDQAASRVEQLAGTLSIDELMRAGRFHFKRDRNRYVVGRGQLREILGWLLRVEPAKLIFSYTDQGKPRLVPPSGIHGHVLHFNLSHSASVAVYAMARNMEIGIDIEQVRAIADMEHILTRFFSRNEAIQWGLLPVAQRQEAFFKAWTRKEAGLKLAGGGIGEALNQIEAAFFPGEAILTGAASGTAQGILLTGIPGYAGALAVQNDIAADRIRCWKWER